MIPPEFLEQTTVAIEHSLKKKGIDSMYFKGSNQGLASKNLKIRFDERFCSAAAAAATKRI